MNDVALAKRANRKLKTTKPFIIPYLVWIAIFLVLPSLILIFLALTSYDFSPNAEFSFTIENWKYVFGSEYASNVFWPAVIRSVLISLCVTLLCLIIGYPVALFMTKMNRIARGILMAFLILPLWCNQVLRIVSWRTIFEILNLNYNEFYIMNIIISMTAMYLPFMILPIYTVLEKIDNKVIEASYDLGCSNAQSLFRVVLPMSLGGIVSGIIMTFLPSLTTFEVSDAISYNTVILVGNMIYSRFQGTGGYNVGSIFSLLVVMFTIVGFVLILKVDKEGETLI